MIFTVESISEFKPYARETFPGDLGWSRGIEFRTLEFHSTSDFDLQAYTWFLDWLGKTAANKAQHVAVRYVNAKAHHVYRILNEVGNWQLEL